jgi:polyisoprenoid-binding protein YceI
MKLFINIIVLLASLSGFAQGINSGKSEVTFEIGNLGFNTVEGSFKKMSGDIKFDSSDLSNASFDVCIDASTIDTDSRKRDEHLKNEDFFDVEKYPKICFVSESIVKSNKLYLAKGRLTMHGVTKQIEMLFTYEDEAFSGSITVNRYDYNLGSQTSKFMVSEEVEVKIVCVLN